MKTTGDNRFDPNRAMQMLVDIAREPSLEGLLQTIVARSMEHHKLACVQFWLIDRGDLCSSCLLRRQCPDQSRCLHLMAGRGGPAAGPGALAERTVDRRQRIPLGVGLLGKVAVETQQVHVKTANADWSQLVGMDWMRQEPIRAINAMPIIFRGDVLGVLAVAFMREDLPEEGRPWGQIFADHIGAVNPTTLLSRMKKMGLKRPGH
jgi:hypothetical protein